MKELNLSPVLDALIKKLSLIAPEEEIESPIPIFRKSFGGPSWDFAGYREYSPTDDASQIDWKASVKTNKTLVKEYTEIQTLNVLFLLDSSSSMLQGTVGKRKSDYASDIISTLSYSILKSKGLVRLTLFNESIKQVIASVNDISQFYQIPLTLSNEKLYGGKANLRKISKIISPHITRGTRIILLSDFLNLGEDWQESLRALGLQSKLICFMVRDPIDISLPKGVNKVFIEEPSEGKKFLFNVRKYRKKYEEASKQQEIEVKNISNSIKANFLMLNTSEPYLDKLISFLQRG